jgi:hypothetical protein
MRVVRLHLLLREALAGTFGPGVPDPNLAITASQRNDEFWQLATGFSGDRLL